MSATTLARRIARQYDALRYLRDRRIALLGGANVLDTMSVSLVVPLLPLYASQQGVSPLLIGVMFAAEPAAQALLSTPFGYLADRFDRRTPIVVGTVLSALSVAALGLVASPFWFIGLRALDGAAGALRYPATAAYIGDMYPEAERGRAMGAYATLGWAGLAIGPAIGGLLATVSGFALPFIALGGATAVAGIVLAGVLPAPNPEASTHDRRGTATADRLDGSQLADGYDTTSGPAPPGGLLRWRRSKLVTLSVVALALSSLLSGLDSGAFYPLFPLLLEQQAAVGPGYTGLVWSAFGLAMFLFTPVGGTVADRVGRKPVLAGGLAVWAVVHVGLVLAPSSLAPVALLFCGGVASALAGPAKATLNYETAPPGLRATLAGLYGSLNSAGAAVGPILGGAAAGWVGVRWVMLGLGVIVLLNAGVVTLGVRPSPTGTESTRPRDD